MAVDESQKQERGDRWSKEWGQNRTLCIVNGPLSFQEFRVGASISKIQRPSRTPRWHSKRWFRIVCSIHWAGIIGITNDGCKSNVYFSRLPGCAGQTADTLSAYTQVKMEDAPTLLKIPKSECPDIWIRLPRHKWPKSWSSMEDPVVPLERNLYGHPFDRTIVGKATRENPIAARLGKAPNWKCLFVNREKGPFLFVHVDEKKNWQARNKTSIRLGKYLWETLIWENRHVRVVRVWGQWSRD